MLDTESADSAATLPDTAEHPVGVGAAPEPQRSTEVSGKPEPVRPRSTRGSSASEQINALLNGSALPEPSTRNFADTRRTRPDDRGTEPAAAPVPQQGGADRPGELFGRPFADRLGAWGKRLAPRLRKPAVMLSAGAVLVVVLVLVLVTTGGEAQQPAITTSVTPTPAPVATEPTESNSGAKPIDVVSATSHCPPGSTDGMDAFSGEAGKAWSCVRAYNVDGQVLTIDLGGVHLVESIAIVPGWDHIRADGVDEWTRHRTASKVSYQFDNENYTTYTQETLDQRGVVTTEMNPPVRASQVILTILASSGDRSLRDTAVSSIVITGQRKG